MHRGIGLGSRHLCCILHIQPGVNHQESYDITRIGNTSVTRHADHHAFMDRKVSVESVAKRCENSEVVAFWHPAVRTTS